MGVYTAASIVQKVNGKVREVEEAEMPESLPIHYLTRLVFDKRLKESLFNIAGCELDLTFFTKQNASAYGDNDNKNVVFSPSEVRHCVDIISNAFANNENTFVEPILYKGIVDDSENDISAAFIDVESGILFWKKQVSRWGTIRTKNNKVTFQCRNDELKDYGEIINLIDKRPTLYKLNFEGKERVKGERLNYKLKKISVIPKIQAELENIRKTVEYAAQNGYELQITQT